LKPEIHQITFKNSVPTSEKTVSITKTDQSMMLREISVYSENHMKHSVGKIQGFWMLQQDVHIVITVLWKVKSTHMQCSKTQSLMCLVNMQDVTKALVSSDVITYLSMPVDKLYF
jgi:hypothetical protein